MVIITKIQRQAKLINIIGRLTTMSTDDTKEFDSLCDRIIKRIDYYENKTQEGFK